MQPIKVKHREKKLHFLKKGRKNKKQSKYKVLMLKSSHKKEGKNNSKITK